VCFRARYSPQCSSATLVPDGRVQPVGLNPNVCLSNDPLASLSI
jgi:hypothetical protein